MNRQRRRLLIALNLAMFAGLLLLLAFNKGLFATWQAQSTDFLFKAKAGDSSSRVAIVAVDDESIKELAGEGRVFNWPRSLYAQVITNLNRAGARVIVLDMLFDAPTSHDDELAAAIAGGSVVLPVAGELPDINLGGDVLSFGALVGPVPVLARVAAGLGHVNVHPDGDGTIRREQLVIAGKGQELPSLALAAAARYLRRQPLESAVEDDSLSFAGRAIPIVDGRRGMLINYVGGPYRLGRASSFPVVSFVDVLRGQADPTALRDRVVVIGVMATGYADDYWTPPSIGQKMAGVEIHANAIETILRPALLRTVDPSLSGLAIMLMALLAGLSALRFRSWRAALVALVLMLGYLIAALILFDRGVVAALIYPMLAPPLSFATVMAYRVRFVESDQRAIRRLLSGYLSPRVMAEVLKEPEKLRLGGEKRTVTVMFSDVRGFTTYSERVDPERLVSLLNEYFSEMSAVVFEHEGVVDKYMGDGLMAFWGAPVKQADQSRQACLAALEMMRRLGVLNERWGGLGIPSFDIGIGVHTGTVAVGNMGSLERFSYTVIGDAVNLTSRLEGLNKLYGTNIIVSGAALGEAGDDLESRFLDRVAVKGKSEPVAAYQLLPAVDGEAKEGRLELLRRYNEGLRLGAEGRWQDAAGVFQLIVETFPDDGPSAFHLKRCREFAQDPSGHGGDWVHVVKTK